MFCIKDLIDKKMINLEHCPTKRILADFFAKSFQRSLFTKFRDVTLGHKPLSDSHITSFMKSKERVEVNN